MDNLKGSEMEAVPDDGDAEKFSDQRFLEAEVHVYNQALSLVKSMCLQCAVQLGIQNLIHEHGRPMTLGQLINGLHIHKAKSHCVSRLMRILTHFGFFVKVNKIKEGDEDEEGYQMTPSSHLLLTHHPFSLTPLLLTFLNPVMLEPWESLPEWLQNGDAAAVTPFDMAHGRTRWDDDRDRTGESHRLLFNEAMASDARLVGTLLTGDDFRHVFEGLESVVDVGGSTGEMGRAIARAFPALKWTVLDLPHVVRGLEGDANLSYVGGNMFESIPAANAVFMKWILHCWSDEESIKILKKCKGVIPCKDEGGKVIIIEMVVGNPKEEYGTQILFDMEDMVVGPGRERTETEWAKLFLEAGFIAYKIFPILGSRCLIEVYP